MTVSNQCELMEVSKITTMSGSSTVYRTSVDPTKRIMKLTKYEDTGSYQFAYEEGPGSILTLSGQWEGRDVVITFKKKDLKDYRLVNSDNPWIRQQPSPGGPWFLK